MSPSAFAGNPFLIDLDELAAEGLLTQQELDSARRDAPDRVDYAFLHETRMDLLELAFRRSLTLMETAPEEHHLPWIGEYAQFAALHDRYEGSPDQWPEDAKPDPGPGGLPHLPPGHLLPPVVPLERVRQPEAHPHHGGRPPSICPPTAPRCTTTRSCFSWMRTAACLRWPGSPPTPSPPTASSGAIPSMTGRATGRRSLPSGRSASSVRPHVRRHPHRPLPGLPHYWSVPAGAESAKEGHWEPGPGDGPCSTCSRPPPPAGAHRPRTWATWTWTPWSLSVAAASPA